MEWWSGGVDGVWSGWSDGVMEWSVEWWSGGVWSGGVVE